MTITLKKLKESLHTGDLLLFYGKGSFLSYFIEIFTKSDYSHCGLIIKSPVEFTNPPLTEDKIYYIESGKPNVGQTECPHNKLLGVQVSCLEEIIKTYDGNIYICQLNWSKSEEKRKEILKEVHERVHNLPYDINPIDWLRAFFQDDNLEDRQVQDFFCSALVGYLYVELGLLEKSTDWDIIRPCDLPFLNLLEDAKLGKVLQIIS